MQGACAVGAAAVGSHAVAVTVRGLRACSVRGFGSAPPCRRRCACGNPAPEKKRPPKRSSARGSERHLVQGDRARDPDYRSARRRPAPACCRRQAGRCAMRPPGRHRLAQRVAAEVRRARRERGWSQLQLADRTRCSLNFVGLVERGKRLPGLAVLMRLAVVLGLPLQRLVLGPSREESWMAEAISHLRALSKSPRRVVLAMLRAAAIAAQRS